MNQYGDIPHHHVYFIYSAAKLHINWEDRYRGSFQKVQQSQFTNQCLILPLTTRITYLTLAILIPKLEENIFTLTISIELGYGLETIEVETDDSILSRNCVGRAIADVTTVPENVGVGRTKQEPVPKQGLNTRAKTKSWYKSLYRVSLKS